MSTETKDNYLRVRIQFLSLLSASILGSTDTEHVLLCTTFCRWYCTSLLTPPVTRPEEEAPTGRQDSKQLTRRAPPSRLDGKAPEHRSPALQALRTRSCSAF